MARYKHIDMSPRLLPVVLEAQLVAGSFAHSLHHLIELLDLAPFDAHFRNDVNGAPAYSPSILLKAVLLAYSQGVVSSRAIERLCRENVLFIAITGDAQPHFTTIADFVSRSRDAIAAVFAQVLTILNKEGLIGREMFAIDGVKLPSNASKHRSGTRADFLAQAEKLERAVQAMIQAHQSSDAHANDDAATSRDAARLQRLTSEAQKIRSWLAAHPEDRKGARAKVRKSNRTDNESAKMATDKGVVQGYCGVAVVDAAHQVVIEASAHGTGWEQELLLPVLEATAAQRAPHTLITADAGYYSETNLEAVAKLQINALIPDIHMRQRDERLADQAKHTSKPDALYVRSRKPKPKAVFSPDQFIIAADHSHAICPAGKRLYRNGKDCIIRGYHAIRFRAPKSACTNCPLRSQCLRKPGVTQTRQVALIALEGSLPYTRAMQARIDSPEGRHQYGRRLGTVEPVFANLRHNKRLTRFTLRGQRKLDGQWKLFALVHNIEKWGNCRKPG